MNIDLDTEGMESLQAEFEELETRGESDRVYEVGTDRDYGSILEFGRGPISVSGSIRGLGSLGPDIPGGVGGDEAQALKFEVDGETIFRKSVSGHPPYPWFRPAIREFKANPETFLLETTDFDSLTDIQTTDELVASVAVGLQSRMEDNVNAQDPSRDRSPGTHPDHPQRDSGNLTASIQATRIR